MEHPLVFEEPGWEPAQWKAAKGEGLVEVMLVEDDRLGHVGHHIGVAGHEFSAADGVPRAADADEVNTTASSKFRSATNIYPIGLIVYMMMFSKEAVKGSIQRKHSGEAFKGSIQLKHSKEAFKGSIQSKHSEEAFKGSIQRKQSKAEPRQRDSKGNSKS